MTRLVLFLVFATACRSNETCQVCVDRCAPFVVARCDMHEYTRGGSWVTCACDVTRRSP